MHYREQRFASFLRSRAVTLTLILAGVVMTVAAPGRSVVPDLPMPGSAMVALPFGIAASPWFAALLSLVVAATMYYINRRYNILRSTKIVYAGLFMLMCGATPAPASWAGISPALAIIMLASLSIFYDLYNRPRERRQVFLVGFMLGCLALFHRASLLYFPVLVVGLTQMRILDLRSLAAIIIGVLTPAWILWAIFDVDFLFDISMWRSSPLQFFSAPEMWRPLAAVCITLLAGFFVGMMVLVKVLTLNARARALNGFLTILSIATALFTIVDFENIYFYLTLLNAGVAFQTAHFFRLNRHRSGYLTVSFLIIAYAAIYLWP